MKLIRKAIDSIYNDLEFGRSNKENENKKEEILNDLMQIKDKFKCNIEHLKNLAEVLYLIGKVFHLDGNLEGAKKFYKNSLNFDKDYIPSEYNLRRINEEGTSFSDDMNWKCVSNIQGSINDYKAIMNVKNLKYNLNLNFCSAKIRKICSLILSAKALERHSVKYLEHLILNNDCLFDKKVLMNNLAVINYYNCTGILDDDIESKNIVKVKNLAKVDTEFIDESKSIELISSSILKRALELESKYTNILKYNLGIITRDVSLFHDLPFLETKSVISLIKREETNDAMLNLYILLKTNKKRAE